MNVLLDPGARPVIGHRGNRAFAPENTIESFAQAVNAGADAIEFDVHVSADGIAVVHHDPAVERTTDGHGALERLTFDELARFDAGAKFTLDGGKTFPYRGKGHRIPSLDEVIEAFPTIPLLIEIKTPLAATAVRATIEKHKAVDRCVVDSFSKDALRIFEGSPIPYGAASGDVAKLMSEVLFSSSITPISYRALCVPLSYNGLPLPVRRFAKIAPKYDCRVHVWTINSPQVARDLWNAGVNGIITDDPKKMLEERSRLPEM